MSTATWKNTCIVDWTAQCTWASVYLPVTHSWCEVCFQQCLLYTPQRHYRSVGWAEDGPPTEPSPQATCTLDSHTLPPPPVRARRQWVGGVEGKSYIPSAKGAGNFPLLFSFVLVSW